MLGENDKQEGISELRKGPNYKEWWSKPIGHKSTPHRTTSCTALRCTIMHRTALHCTELELSATASLQRCSLRNRARRFIVATVPQEVCVAPGVVGVLRVCSHSSLVCPLRAIPVSPCQPQKGGIPPECVPVSGVLPQRPMEESLRPAGGRARPSRTNTAQTLSSEAHRSHAQETLEGAHSPPTPPLFPRKSTEPYTFSESPTY